jgi:hypothetical protein
MTKGIGLESRFAYQEERLMTENWKGYTLSMILMWKGVFVSEGNAPKTI